MLWRSSSTPSPLALPHVVAGNISSTSLLALPAFSNQSEIGSININHTESRSSTALPAPYQYQTLRVVLLSCHIHPLASPRRPNRQLGAQRAHLPASTFTTIMAINYLSIMIGFPVLLALALTNHPGHSILLREAGNAQHSHQGRDGDEPGS